MCGWRERADRAHPSNPDTPESEGEKAGELGTVGSYPREHLNCMQLCAQSPRNDAHTAIGTAAAALAASGTPSAATLVAAPSGARDGSSSAAGRPVLTELTPTALAPGLVSLAAAALTAARNESDACSCGAGAGQLMRVRGSTNSGKWNPDERSLYQEAVVMSGANQWSAIARHVVTRDASQARTHGVRTRRGSGGGRGGGGVPVCPRARLTG